MTVDCAGRTYRTSEMTAFETGDPATPTVYLSRDRDCVFVVTADPWKRARVHQADAVEIKTLAARYHLPELLVALHR
jgi:hypothetical protein